MFPGVAPISLINGERLLELLVEHEIGILKRPATLYELERPISARWWGTS
jgi:restriction system protein